MQPFVDKQRIDKMNVELFKDGMKKLRAEVSEAQTEQFLKYSQLLVEWNKKMNLTAITDPDGISVKHFLDSVLPLYTVGLSDCVSIADIGTGAGFPGIPLKIMRPEFKLTLVDSLNKRIRFLSEVVKELKLDDTECIHARAEELGRDEEYRGRFDAVVSRAVANMTVLCEYCMPLVKRGGIFVALKADGSAAELNAAKSMIKKLGGKLEDVLSVPLPMSDIKRDLIVIRKTGDTPKTFPRRADKIKKLGQNA